MTTIIKVSKVFWTSNLSYGEFWKKQESVSSHAIISRCVAVEILNCSTPLHVYNPNLDYMVIIFKVCPLVKGQQLLNNFYVEAVLPKYFYLPTLRQNLNGLTYSQKIEVLSNFLDSILSGEAKTKQGLTIKESIVNIHPSINGYYISEIVLGFTTYKPGSFGKNLKQNLNSFTPLALLKAIAYLGNGLYLSFSLMFAYKIYALLFII